jgi:hypothetical protein
MPGATTLSITTLSIRSFYVTAQLFYYDECHYAKRRILFTIMLNVVMLSVIMLNVIMLSVVMLSVVAPYGIGLTILGKLGCPSKNKKNTTNKL